MVESRSHRASFCLLACGVSVRFRPDCSAGRTPYPRREQKSKTWRQTCTAAAAAGRSVCARLGGKKRGREKKSSVRCRRRVSLSNPESARAGSALRFGALFSASAVDYSSSSGIAVVADQRSFFRDFHGGIAAIRTLGRVSIFPSPPPPSPPLVGDNFGHFAWKTRLGAIFVQ